VSLEDLVTLREEKILAISPTVPVSRLEGKKEKRRKGVKVSRIKIKVGIDIETL